MIMPILVDWIFTEDKIMITHMILELGTAGRASVLTTVSILKCRQKLVSSAEYGRQLQFLTF